MNRRRFLRHASLLSGSTLLLGRALAAEAAPPLPAQSGWRMPDEGEPHAATWMAFGAREAIWGERLLGPVRQNLAGIARAISAFEPVAMLAPKDSLELARQLCGDGVRLIEQPLDDLWMRDTGPVFVKDALGRAAGVGFHFNGWGGKQAHERDARVAAAVCAQSGRPLLSSRLVLEGGGIEVDGQGTAIITESCVLNPNRNPSLGKAACEAELKRLLGVDKVIWLPGIPGRDITDGHTDFYARFAAPGVVVAGLDSDPSSYDYAVTRSHLAILRAARDARGRPLEVVELEGPSSVRPRFENREFAAGYVNFYVCNGAVIAPQFGDVRADANCRAILRELFPGREVVQLDIDAVAAGGGGIHCTTQQQPA